MSDGTPVAATAAPDRCGRWLETHPPLHHSYRSNRDRDYLEARLDPDDERRP